jgi:hypothetical protein
MSSAASEHTPLGRRCAFLRLRIDESVRLGAFPALGGRRFRFMRRRNDHPVLPAGQMIFHVIGDLLTDRRQLKHLVLDGRIIGLLG